MKVPCHELTLLLLPSALHSCRAHCTVDACTLDAKMEPVFKCQEDILARVVVNDSIFNIFLTTKIMVGLRFAFGGV